MKQYIRSFLILILCAQSPLLVAQSVHTAIFTDNEATKYANITIFVKNLTTGKVVDAYREKSIVPPASTMKVLTTCTALELLGPDYRFSTYLETNGTIQDGVLYGDLYVRGTADPTLGSKEMGNRQFLTEWVRQIQKAGIRKISGGVIADMAYLDGDATNPQWIWEDIGNYYGMGIFGINYLDNTMNITLRSAAVGSVAEVISTEPRVEGLQFENHIRCTTTTNDGAYVHGSAYSNSRYLCGAVPSNLGTFGIRGDLPNPGLLLAKRLDAALMVAGIPTQHEPTYIAESTYPRRTLIYEHQSLPLSEIIKETNLNSNNLYAESIFRMLGAQVLGVPGTIEHSSSLVQNCWRQRGVDISMAKIEDGCGLAPQDAVSAWSFVQVLSYMQGSAGWEAFWRSLPVSGESGTLRSFCANTELAGRVHAKSGTTSQIKAYAGYIDMPNGDRLAFAVSVNNASIRSRQVANMIQKYLLSVYNANK